MIVGDRWKIRPELDEFWSKQTEVQTAITSTQEEYKVHRKNILQQEEKIKEIQEQIMNCQAFLFGFLKHYWNLYSPIHVNLVDVFPGG